MADLAQIIETASLIETKRHFLGPVNNLFF